MPQVLVVSNPQPKTPIFYLITYMSVVQTTVPFQSQHSALFKCCLRLWLRIKGLALFSKTFNWWDTQFYYTCTCILKLLRRHLELNWVQRISYCPATLKEGTCSCPISLHLLDGSTSSNIFGTKMTNVRGFQNMLIFAHVFFLSIQCGLEGPMQKNIFQAMSIFKGYKLRL